MNLDLVVIGLVVFFALLGAAAGGVMQLSHVGAVLVAGLLSRPLGTQLGERAAEHFKVPTLVGVLGVTMVGFVVIYAVVQVLCRVALKRVLGNPTLSAVDRTMGFVLGGGKAAMILFVMLSALVFFEKPLASITLRFDTKGSQIAEFVRSHNLFANFSFPGVKGLSTLAKAGTDPAAAARLAQSPEFAELTKNARIKGIMGDGSLQKALQGGDYVSALRSTKVLEVLTDPQIQSQLVNLGGANLEGPAAKGKAD